jgi:hypothetical protein
MIAEIDINIIPLESLLTIVTAKDDDPLLYYIYHLNQSQLDQINYLLPQKIVFDISKYEYHLECGGIYEYYSKRFYKNDPNFSKAEEDVLIFILEKAELLAS